MCFEERLDHAIARLQRRDQERAAKPGKPWLRGGLLAAQQLCGLRSETVEDPSRGLLLESNTHAYN